ncbi:YceD family protein [Curvibacter sp. HBC61]|uniref:Large ribosomal RNA subunit accumulation protein YceD n=1 Tax=Curvibacter cyanobacteriorum TaxID=3026422 RepID=A0ABT5N0C6_9BURK|nr:YceD family protein [Curvibacter sp. HBC61]MDD0838492.1 YceD family protein [Curvibacter sp. HBC61]
MKKEYSLERLDLKALAQAGDELSGQAPVGQFQRLVEESAPGTPLTHEVRWSAQGETRPVTGGADQIWLHLQAEATLSQVCQRCLGPVDTGLWVDRSFRFVKDEAMAEAEDDESEEDVLALSKEFNLLELIEDELLMELPVVPRHDICPEEVPMVVEDEDYKAAEAEKPNPFAALAKLKKGGLG